MKRFILLCALLLGVFGCGYHMQANLFNGDIELADQIYDGVLSIETKAIVDREGNEMPVERKGVAFAIAPDLILALSHVAVVGETGVAHTMFGSVEVKQTVKEISYEIDGHPLELLGTREDIALFRSDHEFKPMPVPLGDSSTLRRGDVVVVFGNSHLKGRNVKAGVVSAIGFNGGDLDIEHIPYKYDDLFMIDAGLNPGDSGSPVVVCKNGKYYIMGMAAITAPHSEGMGYVIASNIINEYIQDILIDVAFDDAEKVIDAMIKIFAE